MSFVPRWKYSYIDLKLQGLLGIAVFLDEILISGPDFETHLSRLWNICQRLSKFGLTVKIEKCHFCTKDRIPRV